MLENQQAQLVAGLQKLYKRMQKGQGWTGTPPKADGQGMPLTHDILERLGALKQECHNSTDAFDENLTALQQILIANGATMMERGPSHDRSSDDPYEPMARRHEFWAPFPNNQCPPTPPNNGPHPQPARTVSSTKTPSYLQAISSARSTFAWPTPVSEFDDCMDFTDKFDSVITDTEMDLTSFPPDMLQDQMAAIPTNPIMSTTDWTWPDDFHQYVNPAPI